MKEKWFVYRHAEPSGQKESTLFRRCFAYDGSKNVIANITADTRYRLFVNGHYVCRGPESGDAYRKYYDTIDISPWLRQGENCIGVQVLHYAMGDDGIKRFAFGPTALAPSLYGGLCVFSENDAADFDTRGGWKYHNDDGHSFTAPRMAKYAGDMERVDFTKRPLGWMLPDFDDSGWPDAVPVQQAGEGDGAMEYGILRNWNLHRRDIPMMRQTPISPAAVYGQTPGVRFDGILTGEPVTVPAGTEAVCEIDMGQMVTAYVRSEFLPCDGKAEYTYCECYYQDDGRRLHKGQRDQRDGGVLTGETDEVVLDACARVYEPFEYRAFRYLRLRICAGEQPVILKRLTFWQTNYPLDVKSAFRADDPGLEKIWNVSIHTLLCCMQDTYMDCPYYERLQYIMDAMLEAVYTYPLSGDDALARKALLDFASTQMPNGMLHCDAPSNDRHVIPGYGVYFIDMLRQHYRYFADAELVKRYWGVCARLLRFFEERRDRESGLICNCGYWEFVDWTNEWNATFGVPETRHTPRVHYIYSMMYAYALHCMAELTEAAYGPEAAARWRGEWQAMKRCVNETVFDPASGYYRTTPESVQHSQHAQIWAVLSGCAEGAAAKALMERVSKDSTLIRCSYAMQYYYSRAMDESGVLRWKESIWRAYQSLLEKGVTTWPEDPVTARSDCHAWSSVPVYEICHVLLGVKAGAPGFETIVVEPKLLELGSMQASVWTPRGMVYAERRVTQKVEAAELEYTFRIPQTTHVIFRAGGRELVRADCRRMQVSAVIMENGEVVTKSVRCGNEEEWDKLQSE